MAVGAIPLPVMYVWAASRSSTSKAVWWDGADGASGFSIIWTIATLGSWSQYRWSLLTILGICPSPRISWYHCSAASLFLTLYVMWLMFLSRMWSGSIRSR